MVCELEEAERRTRRQGRGGAAADAFPSARASSGSAGREEEGMVRLGSCLLKGYHGGHVVIRFALGGCANRPFFRIVAAHNKRARDGKYLEQLGCLDPLPNSHGEKVAGLNLERLRYWLGCGAQLSRPAEKLLGLAGFLPLHPMTVTGAERLRQRRRRQGQVGTAPVDGQGTAPVDGQSTAPVDGQGTAPVDGQGSAPVEGQGSAPVGTPGTTP